jgi:hypothetical protein
MKADKRYLLEYDFDGSIWAIDIWASSEFEVMQKVKAVASARYLGEIFEEVPAPANTAAEVGQA